MTIINPEHNAEGANGTGGKTRCTCATPPVGGGRHEPDCPVTPLRDAAIAEAARILASIAARRRNRPDGNGGQANR